jgi:hypothetical protein
MVIHAVASYNTSWMADRGKIIDNASEKNLYTNQIIINSREFFLNAISNALHFWKNISDSSAISFQEMNDQDYLKNTDPLFVGGFQFITKAFRDNTLKNDLQSAYYCVQCKQTRPCLLILWKKSKLGRKLFEYGQDINYNINGSLQTGRPILVVLTDKNYYLINIHSPKNAYESLLCKRNLRFAINSVFDKARLQFGSKISSIDPKKIIIMGDFNDPYNGINTKDKLKLAGYEFTFGDILAPKSCCYNFNSSCHSSIYGILNEKQQKEFADLLMYDPSKGDRLDMNPYQCAIVINDTIASRDMRIGTTSEARSLKSRGELSNYKFTGDYCFTYANNKIIRPLSIYRYVNYPDKISHESDHEMVMLIFDDGLLGGSVKKRQSIAKKKQYNHISKKN